MHEHGPARTTDGPIGGLVLPTAPRIGARNWALTGSAPTISATSISTMDVPPTTITISGMSG